MGTILYSAISVEIDVQVEQLELLDKPVLVDGRLAGVKQSVRFLQAICFLVYDATPAS